MSWACTPRFAPPGADYPAAGREDEAGLRLFRLQQDESLAGVVAPLLGLLTEASRRILRDGALADDAVQETLLTFWLRAEPPANPRAWLLRAVTLRSLHLARSDRRRREHERRACLGRSEWSLHDDPARSLDHADLLRVLDDALARVPAESRAVFRLWTFDELDYAAIAATLQVPIGTVRSRLSRVRRTIRAALAGVVADPDAAAAPEGFDPSLQEQP